METEIENAKKLLDLHNKKQIENCTEEYNKFLTELCAKYDVSLQTSGKFINNQIEVVQYFKLNN